MDKVLNLNNFISNNDEESQNESKLNELELNQSNSAIQTINNNNNDNNEKQLNSSTKSTISQSGKSKKDKKNNNVDNELALVENKTGIKKFHSLLKKCNYLPKDEQTKSLVATIISIPFYNSFMKKVRLNRKRKLPINNIENRKLIEPASIDSSSSKQLEQSTSKAAINEKQNKLKEAAIDSLNKIEKICNSLRKMDQTNIGETNEAGSSKMLPELQSNNKNNRRKTGSTFPIRFNIDKSIVKDVKINGRVIIYKGERHYMGIELIDLQAYLCVLGDSLINISKYIKFLIENNRTNEYSIEEFISTLMDTLLIVMSVMLALTTHLPFCNIDKEKIQILIDNVILFMPPGYDLIKYNKDKK